MDWKQGLQKMGIFLRDNAVDYINQCCDEEVVRAKEAQRKIDTYKAVCAFVELKQSDAVIYELLNDHFSVEDISEAREYISRACIHKQIKNLRVYCTERGMTPFEFRKYAEEHSLEEQLKSKPKLLELSPEKLKVHLDKQ